MRRKDKERDAAFAWQVLRDATYVLSLIHISFHGCGWKLVPEALRGLGVKNLYCVEQQMVLDGTFPTVASPNPEHPEGCYLAIELADKVGADFILGTDPDSDLSLIHIFRNLFYLYTSPSPPPADPCRRCAWCVLPE